MTTDTVSLQGNPGVLVAVAALVGIFMTTPGQTVGVSAFVDLIAADINIGREGVLILYSVGTFLGILPAPLIGRLVDRYGPRRVIVPVVLALSAACIVMSRAEGPWSLAFGFVVLRGSAIAGLSLVSIHMVNLWFDRMRGRVTALAMMGLALGGLVIPRLAEIVIASHGWRAAYLTLGCSVLAVMLPVGLLWFRNRPEDYGSVRDFGWSFAKSATTVLSDLTLRQSVKTVAFWYLVLIAWLVNAVGTALLLDHVRVFESASGSRETAILLIGVVTTAQALGALSSGALVDRYGARRVGIAGILMLVGAVVCVMQMPMLLAGYVYAVALGAMIGTLQVVHSAGLAEEFGTAHVGTIRGVTFLVGVTGAATGPLPFVWSAQAGYACFLAIGCMTLALGFIRRGFRKAHASTQT